MALIVGGPNHVISDLYGHYGPYGYQYRFTKVSFSLPLQEI